MSSNQFVKQFTVQGFPTCVAFPGGNSICIAPGQENVSSQL